MRLIRIFSSANNFASKKGLDATDPDLYIFATA
jgi:hypothetical protein